MTYIKICGVTRVEDVCVIADAGAHAVGINLWPGSPRYVHAEAALPLVGAARGRLEVVLVTVDMPSEQLAEITKLLRPDWVQLHGNEPDEAMELIPVPAYKAVGLAVEADVVRALSVPGARVLVDSRDDVRKGGTGIAPPKALAARVCGTRRTILAGGLDPSNVGAAIGAFDPWGVDVASGVEATQGVKSAQAVRAFVDEARRAFASKG